MLDHLSSLFNYCLGSRAGVILATKRVMGGDRSRDLSLLFDEYESWVVGVPPRLFFDEYELWVVGGYFDEKRETNTNTSMSHMPDYF